MKKALLIIFTIILALAVGVITYGLLSMKNNILNNNNSHLESSNVLSNNYSSNLASSNVSSEFASIIASSSTVSSENVPTLPVGWNDNGIFSAYYVKAYQKLLSMTLEEKVGQIILARCPQTGAITSIQNYHLGGFVLFEADFQNKTSATVISTIKSYQNASKIPMFMAVDEEGGTVVRISSNPLLAVKKFQSPRDIYANGGLNAIRADTLTKASLLKKLGVNVNLAPVADISLSPTDYMYYRSLGRSPKITGQYVATVVKAMQDSGLSSTLKHFPGYGNNVDTHTGIAIDNRPYSTFVNNDFIPFEYGISAKVESVLVSHNIVNCMDKGVPASLSPAVHHILRNTLHFTGVIMTDDLSMDAIKDYTNNADPAVKALLAGNDLLVMDDCAGAYNSILTAVKSGTVTEQQVDKAVFRDLAWKYAKGILK